MTPYIVDPITAALIGRIEALERRLEALEAHPNEKEESNIRADIGVLVADLRHHNQPIPAWAQGQDISH